MYVYLFVLPLIASIYCAIRNRKHILSAIYEMLIGMGILTVLAYWQERTVFLSVAVSVMTTVFLAKAYSVVSKRNNFEDRATKKRIQKARLFEVANSARVIFGLGMAVVLAVTLFSNASNSKKYSKSLKESKKLASVNTEHYTVENSIESLSKLVDGTWEETPESEKEPLLQVITNVVANRLGIADIPKTSVSEMRGEHDTMQGYYVHVNNSITVRESILTEATPDNVVNVICHEVYHAYAYCLVDVYIDTADELRGLDIFGNVGEYLENVVNYIRPEDSFEGYYRQQFEVDAREYAEAEAPRLIEEIRAALGGEASNPA